MSSHRKFSERINKLLVLNQFTIAILIGFLCLAIIAVVYLSQTWVERGSLPPIATTSPKEQYEIAKLAAEIRQVRSDTTGSLFWLKMIALFVTVGGAVGGYLVGQSHVTRKRIDFENRNNIDAAYQTIVQELSDKAPLLRAAAAVKLGAILKSFPSEWTVNEPRKQQLIQLTKQVLAASLAIEKDPKVLKTLSIALVLHKHWDSDDDREPHKHKYADARELDLSGANAADAYWAWADFSRADFYKANLTNASFRKSILQSSQFCNVKLNGAVLVEADCAAANFKLADLRKADLSGATLLGTQFERAKVSGCILTGAKLGENPDTEVDNSVNGDGSEMINLQTWLSQALK
jgi:Pentapeptide repeats (9 copies)